MRVIAGFIGWVGLSCLIALPAAAEERTPSPGVAAAEEKTPSPGAGFDVNDCRSCHENEVKTFETTRHGAATGAQSCEACHGPVTDHVRPSLEGGDPGPIRKFKDLSPQDSSGVCQSCHDNKGQQKHWVGSTHDTRGVSCVNCHNPHPKGPVEKALLAKPQLALCTSCHLQRKGQLMRSGHMPLREGKIECSSCHNPHGTPNDRMLHQTSVNQNCYSCHAEKRGPFLFEHAPVRENCLNCHDAHGTIADKMLKVRPPLLCQQCHQTSSHPGPAYPAQSRYAFNQGCLHCHPSVHGSIHPSGNRFFR